jgi:hypothetical protein
MIPCHSDYAEGTSFKKIQEENKWLTDFIDPETKFDAAVCEFDKNPNETT